MAIPQLKGWMNGKKKRRPIPSGAAEPEDIVNSSEFPFIPENQHVPETIVDVATNEAANNMG